MKKVISLLLSLSMILMIGCQSTEPQDSSSEKQEDNEKPATEATETKPTEETISIKLPPLDLNNPIKRTPKPSKVGDQIADLKEIPHYSKNSTDNFQIDLRDADLSRFDLSSRLPDLLLADFNSNTIWPEQVPPEFDHNKILELGKDPGLGLKDVHKSGITGKGISIGIIDQTLLVDHDEIKDNIKYYEEIGEPDMMASMHGTATSSIAVGKNVGVAPEANLYYIASSVGTYDDSGFSYDYSFYALGIERLLEINKSLSESEKIRVITMQTGWNGDEAGVDKLEKAIEDAKSQGVFIVSSNLKQTYNLKFNGLGRDPLADPNTPESFRPGAWLIDNYCKDADESSFNAEEILFVPMGNRTTAYQGGTNEYVYYEEGGWSWCTPYIAGLYALACQADPDITYDKFWEAALSTATPVTFKFNDKEYSLPKVVCPQKLISTLQHK